MPIRLSRPPGEPVPPDDRPLTDARPADEAPADAPTLPPPTTADGCEPAPVPASLSTFLA